MQRPKITALQLKRTGVPEGTVRIYIQVAKQGRTVPVRGCGAEGWF
jgi:hypothetical protein